jgi:DNA-binding response OmpR family regulator
MSGTLRTISKPLKAAAILARLKLVDSEYLKQGDERRAVAAHELAINPHRQYITADQAILAAQFFG